jgi:hypothetical protein
MTSSLLGQGIPEVKVKNNDGRELSFGMPKTGNVCVLTSHILDACLEVTKTSAAVEEAVRSR